MAEVIEFGFEDADGNEAGTFQTRDRRSAIDYARAHGLRVMARTYELADSEEVEDFTSVLPAEDTPPVGHAWTITFHGADRAHEQMDDAAIGVDLAAIFGESITVTHLLSEPHWPLVWLEDRKLWSCGQCGGTDLGMYGLAPHDFDVDHTAPNSEDYIAVRSGSLNEGDGNDPELDLAAHCRECDVRLHVHGGADMFGDPSVAWTA